MKFKINDRQYHIKENIKIKLDGFVLIFLTHLCVRTGAGGAAFFMELMGMCFLLPQPKPRKRSMLYCFARTLVEYGKLFIPKGFPFGVLAHGYGKFRSSSFGFSQVKADRLY